MNSQKKLARDFALIPMENTLKGRPKKVIHKSTVLIIIIKVLYPIINYSSTVDNHPLSLFCIAKISLKNPKKSLLKQWILSRFYKSIKIE